jgi:hypothetical protein
MRQARVELRGIVAQLEVIQARMLDLSQRLTRAAPTGEVIWKVDGKPFTLEEWLSDALRSDALEGSLADCIAELQADARNFQHADAGYHVVNA